MNKSLTGIARENLDIFKKGFYCVNNNDVSIKTDLDKSIENSIYIKSVKESLPTFENQDYKVQDNLRLNTGTINASLELINELGGNVIALNFASATAIGGGFRHGAKAQEECICRSSALYQCLLKFKSYYRKNIISISPLYEDYLIYSPYVPVFRDDDYDFLQEYKNISFITSPAVNKKIAGKIYSDKRILEEMDRKIELIIKFAVTQNPTAIVLGAFGCGVFGNDRKDIYPIFEKYINKYVPVNKIKVVFAEI